MTAYSASATFRPHQRDFSAGPSNMSFSTPWIHEAGFETYKQPRPQYFPPPANLSSPFEAGNNLGYLQRHNESGWGDRIKSDDNHGPDYHHGKVWESVSLQERYDASVWTTSSSSQWTINHANHDSAELNLQYPPPSTQPFQITHQPATSGIAVDGSPFIGDIQGAPVLRSREPPHLAPAEDGKTLSASPTLSTTRTPLPYHPAHQPIPPEKQSSYSELSANLKFMEEEEELRLLHLNKAASTRPLTITIPRPSARVNAANTTANSIRISPTTTYPPSPLKKRKRSKRMSPQPERSGTSDESSAASATRGYSPSDTASHDTTVAGSGSSTRSSSSGAKNYKEPRKPSLACTFCRERKISCGRPPPGSPDPTCNQCARRSFKCTYINEHGGKHLGSRRR